MTARSSMKGLIAAASVTSVAILAPLAFSTLARHSTIVRSVQPTLPLSIVQTPMIAVIDPPVPPVPVPAGINIVPLPPPEFQVSLENVNTGETATFSVAFGGVVRPDQAAAVTRFFRCRRTGKQKPLDPGVLTMLIDVSRKYPGHVIEIVSGYRSPPFGAPHSRHFLGHAIDLRVRGVRTAAVRDYVWREHHGVGVGYYSGENFVHMDTRPGDPDTAWSAHSEDKPPEYNPRWAKRARRPLRPVRPRPSVASAPHVSTTQGS
jgi:uncharacterized protein YcbK (DUF882 family)